jgi:O-antigen/teichoic acid export membrane protein
MNKKLLKNSIIFIIGDFINKAAPFLILPVLTRYLTQEDYGLITIFMVTISLFSVFVGVSAHGAINVNFFRMEKKELKVFIANVIVLLNITTALLFVVVIILSPYITEFIEISKKWLFIAVLVAFAKFFTTINLTLWISEGEPRSYTIYQFLETITTLLFTIVFIVSFSMNWEGQFLAITISSILFSIVSILFIVKRGYFTLKISKLHIRDALKFGVPLIPHALSGLIRQNGDKLVLISLLGSASVGIYSVGFQLASVVLVFVVSFNKAWSPYLFKVLSSNPLHSEKLKIIKYTYVYFVFILLFSILSAYLLELIVPYFLGINFIESGKYIFYLCISFSFYGMTLMVGSYILYEKKSHLVSMITFTTSMLQIGLLFVLIDIIGIMGAVYTNLIINIVNFILISYFANRVYEMPWNILKS